MPGPTGAPRESAVPAMPTRPLRAMLLLLLGLLATALSSPVRAQDAEPPLGALRVATGTALPFVFQEGNGRFTGFSIELWTAVAHRLGATTEFIDLGQRSDAAQLQAVRDGRADLAIGALAITPDRERVHDFSVSYFDSGLQIMVLKDAGSVDLWATAAALLSGANLRIIAIAGLMVLLLAHVLWLVERRADPRAYGSGYFRAIGNGIWGVVLIIATGEHGDRDTPRIVKRITIAIMWTIGVVLIAQFTATLTSSLTVQQLQSAIRGPDDLPGRTVGTMPGSIAAEYLQSRGIAFVPLTGADQAMQALTRRTVDAIVFEAPTLQYWVAQRARDSLDVVGPVFNPERYGIAVALGSPLRKRINTALLEMMADGSFEALRNRWFRARQQ